MTDDRGDGFLARWSQRKTRARDHGTRIAPAPQADAPGVRPEEAERATQAPARALDAPTRPPDAPAVQRPPAPTLDEVAALTRDADFSRFVAPGVDDGVKRAALTKLFSDPRFNVMDGLDTYIDDYNKADPLPASMLRKMTQSASLGLFREDDENPDLQLQPDDADRRPGAEPGAAGEPGPESGRPDPA
jgi:hypothetical protein